MDSEAYSVQLRGQLFNFWKWRALRTRRAFFFPIVCAIMNSAWASAHYLGTHYLLGHEAESETAAYTFYTSLPNAMYVYHGVAFVLYLTPIGRRLLNESQGKRLLFVNSLSMTACMLYFLLGRITQTGPSLLTDAETGLLFGVLSIASLVVPHHCGLPQLTVWISYFISTALCIAFFSMSNESKWASVAAILLLFVIAVSLACEDYELCRTYLKEKAKEKDTAMSKHHTTISKDLTFALNLLNNTHSVMLESMHAEGLMKLHRTADSGYEWSAQRSYYEQCKLLCLALLTAMGSQDSAMKKTSSGGSSSNGGSSSSSNNDNNFRKGTEIGVYFSRECGKVFAMLEAASGQALPLFYTDDETPEIFFTATPNMIQILLFLLLSEAVSRENPSICSIRLEKNAEEKWVVEMQIALIEESATFSSIFAQYTTSTTNNNNKNSLADDDCDCEYAPETNFADGIGKFLSADYTKSDFHTPLTRLASKIANFHANIQIKVDPPEFDQGVAFLRRSFLLPGNAPFAITDNLVNKKAWILVEQHTSDFEALADLKGKLELLRIPAEICKGGVEYKYKSSIHKVVVISEAMLHHYHEQLNSDLIRLSTIRVVLCESDIDVEDIETKFNLTNVHRLHRFATLHDVMACIQQVVKLQPPRTFYMDDEARSADKNKKSTRVTSAKRHAGGAEMKDPDESSEEVDELELAGIRSFWMNLLDRLAEENEFVLLELDDCRAQLLLLKDHGSFLSSSSSSSSPSVSTSDQDASASSSLLNVKERKMKRSLEIFMPCIATLQAAIQQQSPTFSQVAALLSNFELLATEEGHGLLAACFKLLQRVVALIDASAHQKRPDSAQNTKAILIEMLFVIEKVLWTRTRD